MNETRAAWIALNLVPGLSPATRTRLLEACGGPVGVMTGTRSVPGLPTDIINNIGRLDWKTSVYKELERAREQGIGVVTPVDPSYPPKLLEIHDPPPALYVLGALQPGDVHAVAVVGSRRASFYGLECAREFGHDLALAGITVVSGMAIGADSAAHRGALEAGGRTLAVLGSGLDVPYPRRNRKLMRQVADGHGAVLSEFPLGTPPLPYHFPRRNRVIAGLALGTVVVEASAGSGSLITAQQAVDEGREVFALPDRITAERSVGTNHLIRAGHARLVQRPADVLEELPGIPDQFRPRPVEVPAPDLPEDEAAVLACLGGDDPVAVDVLAGASEMEMGTLLNALLSLEMRRLVRSLPGGRYVRMGRGGSAGA
jgi:DNA processing protein